MPASDHLLFEAWDRRVATFKAYNALPHSEKAGEPYTPEEAAQWAIIDEAEEVSRATEASTPAGVAVQLWACLAHSLDSRADEQATFRRDLSHFEAKDTTLDWTDRLVLAALRSLAIQT